jgi:predicted SprT family Zn-dependent metalloprotease
MRLNLILLVENEEHYLANVVPHEVAHLINRRVNKPAPGKKKLMPHGKEWKDVMALLGVVPHVKHRYDCTSIEKGKKAKRKGLVIDRVTRIMKQVMRLTEEERYDLTVQLEAI